jgi:phage terminase large subunit
MLTILAANPAEASVFSWREGQTRLVCKNGSEIEFVTFEDEQKAAAGKRTYLIVDEANTISYQLFDILAIRTTKKIILAYNPVSPFWAHTKIIPLQNTRLIISGYRNNQYAPKNLIDKLDLAEIENPNYFNVYGLGLTGSVEGVIFNVQYAPFPSDCEILGVGLDWGFATSPTAAVLVGRIDDTLYFKEILYEYRQLPRETVAELMPFIGLTIVADSASPSANAEMSEAGYLITPVKKPAVVERIRFMQNFKIFVDPSSKNMVQEAVGYVWNNQGTAPIKDFDHCWDAAGYLVWSQLRGGARAL